MARPTDTLEQDRRQILSDLDGLLETREIDADDHRRRTEVARQALDQTELAAVRPAAPFGHADQAPAEPPLAAGRATAARYQRAPEKERGFVFACMGGSMRKGSWEPPDSLFAFALMGGIELDFREAALLEGTTEVQVLAVMGGVNIIVPDDIDVEVTGFGFMGAFEHVSQHVPEPGRPLLRIKGLALMGGVSVKVKPAPGSKRSGKLSKRLRKLL